MGQTSWRGRVFGHAHGVESVRATVEAALESGVGI